MSEGDEDAWSLVVVGMSWLGQVVLVPRPGSAVLRPEETKFLNMTTSWIF